LLEKPEGFIMASSHVGNPELCGYLLKQNRKRINGLIFGHEKQEVQKNRTATLGDNNVRLIPVQEDMSHIFTINEALTNGEIVTMPADRLFGSSKSLNCDFIRGKADFPIGAFALAVQYQTPVLVIFVIKVTALRYRIHISQINIPDEGGKRDKINSMTTTYVEILEKIVKQYPEQWFNFYEFWKNV
jgi:predicted LPLAT superfamily acyltransferase